MKMSALLVVATQCIPCTCQVKIILLCFRYRELIKCVLLQWRVCDESDLENGHNIVCCSNCTSSIRVLYDGLSDDASNDQ